MATRRCTTSSWTPCSPAGGSRSSPAPAGQRDGKSERHVPGAAAQGAEPAGAEDAVLSSWCFDANLGVFAALLGPDDAVFSDALNHASLIDGIRLAPARRFVFAHADHEISEE
nr:aminotransferase class I/II-fold pyridoxal phosphate-dependent enzyme [Actinomadura sp. RB99]